MERSMIPWFKPNYWGNEKKYVLDALDSTWISDGEYIRKFEKEFADTLSVKHTITVSSGTAALQLALLSLQLEPNDEVIVPAYTFAAPANMAIALGAKPVFVDVDPNTWCISPEAIESKITKKTKVIIPVHIYGNVCDMKVIMEIAKQYKIAIIEDVAEAAFSKYDGKYAGSFGDFGCFSFQATKTIATGEGGAVASSDSLLLERAKLRRNHGMRPAKRYWHEIIGHNFRLTNMQAALGYAQLECRDTIIKNKCRVYQEYKKRLQHVEILELQHISTNIEAVIWAIAVKIKPEYFKASRDNIILKLQELGIETRPGFYSFSQMPLYKATRLPVGDYVSQNIISLPSYPTLTEDEIDYICKSLLEMRNS